MFLFLKNSFQIIAVIVFLLQFSGVCMAQEQLSSMDEMVVGIDTRISNFPLEKVFIHTDRPYYVAGDDIWFAVYAVNGHDHSLDPVSGLVYVEFIDPKGNVQITRHVQLNGKQGEGLIELINNLEEGIYQLRAYTSYMDNYAYEYAFTKEIAIYAKSGDKLENKEKKEDYPLRFFPEGGELVAGISSKVAFELADQSITSLEVLNSSNEVSAHLKVAHDGIGSFTITPVLGETYKVTIDGKDFKLPFINPRGYGIKVNNLNKDFLYIDLQCSADLVLDGGFILGHIRGMVFLQQENLSGSITNLKIDKSGIPEGVAQFTLFDNKGRAVAERSVFIRKADQDINVSASIPYEYINTRQKVALDINLDVQDAPVDGDFSISVVDAGLVLGQENQANIKSYLLLGSEFTKPIPNINTYFTDDSKKTSYYLDLLMMTKKWSRIRWQDVKANALPEIKSLPESGFTISGMLTYKGDPIKGYVDISVVKESISGDRVQTDENGRFFVNLIGLQDSTTVYVNGGISEEENSSLFRTSDGVTVTIFGNNRFDINSKNVLEFVEPNVNDILSSYIDQSRKIQSLDSIYDNLWTIDLEEVSIKARNINLDKELKKEFNIPYSNYSNRIMLDSLKGGENFRSIFDIVRNNVPGVEVIGTPNIDQRFRIRGGNNTITGNNDAIVVLDGVETTIETINTIWARDVAFIDVLKGPSTSVLYGAGANGVVCIYTKKRSADRAISEYEVKPKTKIINYEGYLSNRQFYSPDYSKSFAGSEKPDLRTTLYWNPKCSTTNGKSTLDFYSSDKISNYIVEIQGITKDGKPIVGYSVFEVR